MDLCRQPAAHGEARHGRDINRTIGPDKLEEPHVALIFHLLVMQHQDYAEFIVQDGRWPSARKVRGATKIVKVETTVSVKAKLIELMRRRIRARG